MAAIITNFIVKHHVLGTFQCIVINTNMKNSQSLQNYEKFFYRICLSTMILLSFGKGSIFAILFVYISLATVMLSKVNVENSKKAWYVNETDSYRFYTPIEDGMYYGITRGILASQWASGLVESS